MKYLYLIIIFVIQLTASNHAHATSIIASTFPQQLVQQISDLVGNASVANTSISTTVDMLNNTIIKPIGTGLINVAQQQIANDIINWANGGFEGQPLIISNPEKFIKNQGMIQVKIALDQIPEDSIYGDSIFNSLVDQYKDGEDAAAQLKALSKSNIPGIIQSNLCNDEALTALATEDVEDAEGHITVADVTNRKTELFNYACTGNADTDPATAAKIMELNDQVAANRGGADLGGWDKWLAVTGGDNTYTKSMIAKNIPEKKAAEAKETAKNEIYSGAGPVSQTKCVEWSEAQAGEDAQCLKEETLTPGEQIGGALTAAANSGLDRLTNLTGEGLTSLITSLALTKLTAGLNKKVATSGVNKPVVIVKRSPPSKDLIGDPIRKKEIQNPMQKQFTFYTNSLNELEGVDNAYLADLNAYQGIMTEGKSCYDSLVTDKIIESSNAQFTNASNYYSNRQTRINGIKSVIVPELSKIAEARTLITTTQNKMAASNSTEEISTIFNDYTVEIDNGGFPQSQMTGVREGEYLKNKGESQVKEEVDTYTNYKNTCDQIRASPNGGGGGAPCDYLCQGGGGG